MVDTAGREVYYMPFLCGHIAWARFSWVELAPRSPNSGSRKLREVVGMTESFGACFGRSVREKRRGWTQEYLAELVWGDPSYKSRISDLERGKVDNPQNRTVLALAEKLGISAEEIDKCREIGRTYAKPPQIEEVVVTSAAAAPSYQTVIAESGAYAEAEAKPSHASLAAIVTEPEETSFGTEQSDSPQESAQPPFIASPAVEALARAPPRWRSETSRLFVAVIGVILTALALILGRGDRVFNSVASEGDISGSTITIGAPDSPEH